MNKIDNKTYMRNYMQKYTKDNHVHVECEICNCEVIKYQMYRHKQTKKHERNLKKSELKKNEIEVEKSLNVKKIEQLEQQIKEMNNKLKKLIECE